MKGGKLTELLRVLSSREIKNLGRFIHSPYFNTDEGIKKFFDVITASLPAIEKEAITKAGIYKKLYPGKKYDDLKLRHLSSRLYQLCIEFLTTELAVKKETVRNAGLLEEFRKRGLQKEFLSLLGKTKQQMEETKVKQRQDYYSEYLINSEYNLFIESQHKREQEPNLQKVSDSLDKFYLAGKLKLYCQVLSYRNMMNYEYNIALIEEIINYLRDKDFTAHPLIFSYYKAALMMLERENEQHFFELRDYLEKNLHLLEKAEQENLLVLSKNYCIRRLNTGALLFVKELFKLYQLEFGGEKKEGYSLSPLTFKNVVAVGLKLNEFEWTKKFMEEHVGFLPQLHSEAVYSYNMAKYYFAQRDFSKVTGLLSKVEPVDIFLRIDSRILLLKTYYEKKDELALHPLLLTLKSFIRRKTLLSYHKNSYLNFLAALEKISAGDELPAGKQEILKKQVEQEKELVDKEWLLEKIAAH